jgi:hypothetical protein
MAQSASPEAPRDVGDEYSLGEYSPAPSVAELLFDAGRRIGRSEPRNHLSAPLWLTSLHKPGVFEVVPTENVSRFGVRVVTREFWRPGELVLASSPPGFCVQGSVVYCKRRQVVELVLDEYPPICERCSVVWVGKPGSTHEGEVGLETV